MFVDGGSPATLDRRLAPAGGGGLGALASRVRPTAASRTRLLPVPGPLVPLMPDGGLRRGSVVHCTGEGALSLMLAVVGAASAAGSWCGLVGVEDLGALAAAGYGVDLRRLVVVRAPAAQWAVAAGRLLEGFDVVAVEPPGRARPQARARWWPGPAGRGPSSWWWGAARRGRTRPTCASRWATPAGTASTGAPGGWRAAG